MRLLADENFPRAVVEELRAEGHQIDECVQQED
jgi:hypothetical protein